MLTGGFIQADDFSGAQRILKARSAREALGLPPGATPEQVKSAHRALAKEFFPAANLGDKLATEVMQKLNGAKDELTKAPIDKNSRSYYGSDAGSTGGARSEWSDFGARMDAAKSAEERAKVRADQVNQARSAMDFSTIAASGRGAQGAREAVEFALAHMGAFLQRGPGIREMNALAATGQTAEGQQAIYRAALAQASTPEQMLKLLKPELSAMGGGMNWMANLEAAIKAELPRFFELGPSAEQIDRLRSTLRVAYGPKGGALFEQVAKKAIAARKGASSLLPKRGLMDRIMGRLAKRFMAVDPSLATGVASVAVGQAEAQALDEGTCPTPFVKSSGLVLTAEYRRTLAVKGRDFADLVAYDCGQKSPELGQKLSRLLAADREDGA